ncbi:MAG: hypothetical protein P1Q69_13170 [Candidatus Thorarchaeota archaeon]|nr:hypothetical protein [Candidatus Thorarchaeota archaeon]
MKFRERWKIAGTIAQEIRFNSLLEQNPSNLSRIKEKPEHVISQIKRSASLNAFMTGFVVLMIGILMLVSLFLLGNTGNIGLEFAVSIGIFFGMGFALIFFMNLVSATGFFNAGAMILPSTLPFSKSDLEGLMLLTFARVFIAPIVFLLIIFPTLISVVFGITTGIFVFVALVATAIIALGVLIRVAGWFHAKSQSGDESVFSTIIRIGAGLGMMVGILVAYGAMNFVPAVIEFINLLSSTMGSEIISLLALLFPLSFGFLAAILTYGLVFSLPTIIAACAASIIYLFLGLRSYQTSGGILRSLALGGVAISTDTPSKPIDLHISTQIPALIRKDLRVATRSLGSVMLLVFPPLMIFAILPALTIGFVIAVRSFSVLLVMGYTTIFAGLSMMGLLGLDTQGASVYEGLPLRTNLVLNAKIAMFATTYTATILIAFALLLASTLISPFLLLIPLFQLPCAYSIGAAVGGTIYKTRGGGRVTSVNLVGDQAITFIALIVSGIVGLMPLIGYAVALLQTGNHLWSILVQLLVSVTEMVLLRIAIPRILKD